MDKVFGKGGLLENLFLPGFAHAGADTSFQVRRHPSDDEADMLLPDSIQKFAPQVWTVDGPTVDFFGFPYPTRMVLVRLPNGFAWVWSPTALTDELAIQVEKFIGPVKYIVSPNKIHWKFLKEWQDRFPEAKVYAPPGLAERRVAKDIKFHSTLSEETLPEFSDEIDQVVFEGGAMDEVVFFHKASKTVIVCDLIQRHLEANQRGFKGCLMRADGLVGKAGSTPKEWTFAFWICGKLPMARKKLNVILEDWKPQKMIIAHGELVPEAACAVIEDAMSWIPTKPKECVCCRPK